MTGKLLIGLHMTAGEEQTRRYAEGVLKYVEKHTGLEIADFCYPGDDPDLSELPPWTGKVDGVAVSIRRLPGVLPWLRRGGVPVVSLAADLRKDNFSVFTNPRSVAKMAVEHFQELGFSQFAYIGYRHADGSQDRSRVLGEELAKHHLKLQYEYHTEKLLSGTYKDFDSLDAVEGDLLELIRTALKPLAIVAINDRFAAGICRIAHAMELAIPGDVAVLGVRDLEIARISSPPISSIRPDDQRAGYEAAHLLHRLMRGQQPTRRLIQIPALELVARESTVGKRRAAVTDVDRALEYIRQKACEGILIEHVAAHVHVPLRTFELQFAKAVGHTVGVEIRNVRLQRAKTMLETTDLSLQSIAKLLGMNAGSYLSEFFRRWTGTTPIKYRQQCRKGK